MKVHYESKLLDWFPEGTVAFTFGEHVFVGNACCLQETLLHESHHVTQFRKLGRLRFTILFFWWCLTRGYQDNPLEIQARSFAADRMARYSLKDNDAYLHEMQTVA